MSMVTVGRISKLAKVSNQSCQRGKSKNTNTPMDWPRELKIKMELKFDANKRQCRQDK